MAWFSKRGARRQEIRKNRPDSIARRILAMRASGAITSIWVAVGFCVVSMAILSLRQDVVPYRPGEYTPTDINARVAFRFADKDKLAEQQQLHRDMEPRVYSATADVYEKLEDDLTNLPQRVAKLRSDELDPLLKNILDAGALSNLQEAAVPPNDSAYQEGLKKYMAELRQFDPIVLPEDQRHEELMTDLNRSIALPGRGTMRADSTFSNQHLENLDATLQPVALRYFRSTLAPKIVALTLVTLKNNPTHTMNSGATLAAQNAAAARITTVDAERVFTPKQTLVPKGEITTKGWQLLKTENEAYLHEESAIWKMWAGSAASVIMLTVLLSAYIAKFQPRIVRNHARALAIAALMLSMLLLAQIAGIGTSPTYVFGVAPTIVVAMILTIAYDRRFAAAIASVHGLMVTMALNQSLEFFLVVWTGAVTCCFLLDEIRSRSKLIEVGGLTAIALIVASFAVALMRLEPLQFMMRDALYAGAAGLGVGFLILGILPFIEKAFKITTSMTLLELADASQPLLRRLSMEAPGTYNHSLQVATLSEEAAEAIGANSLLCRVGAYYHDIGKVNKPDYFIENQSGGENRHINLNPNVSYLIIIGHVKDGVAMAKEYNLPTKLLPFIEQHHGTTLVEFFYQRACDNCPPDEPRISETQFRYAGPKPKTREIAILMLADCVESACRAMSEPTASRIETLVHDLAMKRLQDKQFDECDLTLRDLERIEQSMTKTLLGIYHGRIPYPSTQHISAPADISASGLKTA